MDIFKQGLNIIKIMGYNMGYQAYNKENMARAKLVSANVSTKQAIELCRFIKRFKDIDKAINVLENIISKKQAVPFTSFTEGAGHKPGIGPGKYPVKASRLLLKLLQEVKTNALSKSLDTLSIVHLAANRASRPQKYGRFLRRYGKRTHIEVVVMASESELGNLPKKTGTKTKIHKIKEKAKTPQEESQIAPDKEKLTKPDKESTESLKKSLKKNSGMPMKNQVKK